MTTLDLCRKVAEVWGWGIVEHDGIGDFQYAVDRRAVPLRFVNFHNIRTLGDFTARKVEAETDPAKIERLCLLVPNWTTLHAPSIMKELARLLREVKEEQPAPPSDTEYQRRDNDPICRPIEAKEPDKQIEWHEFVSVGQAIKDYGRRVRNGDAIPTDMYAAFERLREFLDVHPREAKELVDDSHFAGVSESAIAANTQAMIDKAIETTVSEMITAEVTEHEAKKHGGDKESEKCWFCHGKGMWSGYATNATMPDMTPRSLVPQLWPFCPHCGRDKDFAPPFTCDNESPNSDRISFRDSNGKRIPEWVICNMLNATHNQ